MSKLDFSAEKTRGILSTNIIAAFSAAAAFFISYEIYAACTVIGIPSSYVERGVGFVFGIVGTAALVMRVQRALGEERHLGEVSAALAFVTVTLTSSQLLWLGVGGGWPILEGLLFGFMTVLACAQFLEFRRVREGKTRRNTDRKE
jgi:hypothetical protein